MWGKSKIDVKVQQNEDKIEKKATKTVEDFGAGVVTVRVLDNRIKALKQTHWGQVDKGGQPAGAITWLSDVMEVILGLGRMGVVPEKQLRAAAWWCEQAQRSLDKNRVKWAYTCEATLRYYFAKWSLVSVRPEDVSGPLAIMAIPARPGQDREPQKLVDT